MSERMFVAMHETNDHEGETWTWFLQLDGNEAEIDKLARLLRDAEEGDDEFSYSLELSTREPEPIVDKIVAHAHTGYYASHNKVTGSFACPDDLGEYADELYKGGIRGFFLDAPADNTDNAADA
ncbi:MAG: hypothetical protein L0I76_23100 [Pseudonocardia sp.]|nr:hypothetical protein [Pseudonocardia sp.]